MTTITFTTLFVMVACVASIAIGFYYIGYQDGMTKERLRR